MIKLQYLVDGVALASEKDMQWKASQPLCYARKHIYASVNFTVLITY